MRVSTIVMIGFAVLFGLLAVVMAQSWINSQADARMRSLEASKGPMATRTIVVAGKPLRYGHELTVQSLREIAWPDADLPNGAFGFALFVLPWVAIVLRSLRRLRAPAPDRWFLVAMLGSIVLIFIDGATLDYRFYSYVPMLAWLSLALLRRCLAGPVPA